MNAWRRVSARRVVTIGLAITLAMATAALAAATVAVAAAAVIAPQTEPCEFAWQRGLPVELDGPLYAAAVYDDGRGAGPELYLGGEFFFGSQEEQAIVKWDGANLRLVGGGINHLSSSYAEVHALIVYNGELIAAGDFSEAGGVPALNVARWNGTRWAPLGSGVPEIAWSLAVHDGKLVVGGERFLSSWDGTQWTTPSLSLNGTVYALTSYNGALIAGGDFYTVAAGSPSTFIRNLVQVSGTGATLVGGGVEGEVRALAVYEGALIAGGSFYRAGGLPIPVLARWNGTQWSTLSGGPDIAGGEVLAITHYNGGLVIGGRLGSVGGVAVRQIAQWNAGGSRVWSALGNGFDSNVYEDSVRALTVLGTDLIAAGQFPPGAGYKSMNWGRWTCAGDLPNEPPTADAGGPYSGVRYGSVVFDGSRSVDPDGGSLGFIWDFGDGTAPVSSGPTMFRSYLRAGTFTVTLRVTDGTHTSAPVTTTATIADVNFPPTISLTSPAPNATLTAPATIAIAANAADSEGPVREVEFFRDGVSLGIARTAPFTLSWPNVTAGRYVLTARATDSGGLTRTSSPVTVFVETAVGVTADAYVRDGASANSTFGGAAALQVRTSTSGNTRWTYLKFDTSGVASIARARLRLFGALSGTSGTSVQTAVYPSSVTAWNEATLTWNNKPAAATTALASVTMTNSTTARWYEWDVTNYLRQERAAGRHIVTLVLKNSSSSTVNDAFNAKEAGSNPPQLAITP